MIFPFHGIATDGVVNLNRVGWRRTIKHDFNLNLITFTHALVFAKGNQWTHLNHLLGRWDIARLIYCLPNNARNTRRKEGSFIN